MEVARPEIVFKASRFERADRVGCVVLISSILVSGLLSVRAGKDLNWDIFNYHFYNGWASWTGHTWTNIAPAQLQSFFNPALDILQYLLIAHLQPRWVAFIVGAFQGVCVFLVFAIVRGVGRLGRGAADTFISLVPATVALTGPLAASELGSTMGDLTLTVPVLLAVLAIVQAFNIDNSRQAAQKVIIAGACLGIATGIKYTVAIYAAAGASALLILPPPTLSRSRTLLCFCTVGTAGFVIAGGPWMLALDAHYGSPTLPFFNAWFRSPYMVPMNWADRRYAFRDWSSLFAFPFSIIRTGAHHNQLPFRSVTLASAWCCVLASTVAGVIAHRASISRHSMSQKVARKLPLGEQWLILYFGLSYLVWANVFGAYRYFIPSEVLAPVIITVTICQFISSPAIRAFGVASAAVVMVVFSSRVSWGRGSWGTPTYFDVGLPPAAKVNDALVVMTGRQPLSFVIPFFANGTRFVRVQSNFTGIQSAKYTELLSQTLAEYRGPVALLTSLDSFAEAGAILRQYRLAISPGTCEQIRSVDDTQIMLCRLVRN
jgi:hypothetical protein